MVDLSSGDWRLRELRSVTINFSDLHDMTSTVGFKFVDRVQWIGVPNALELVVALRVDISSINIVIGNVGDPVLL